MPPQPERLEKLRLNKKSKLKKRKNVNIERFPTQGKLSLRNHLKIPSIAVRSSGRLFPTLNFQSELTNMKSFTGHFLCLTMSCILFKFFLMELNVIETMKTLQSSEQPFVRLFQEYSFHIWTAQVGYLNVTLGLSKNKKLCCSTF